MSSAAVFIGISTSLEQGEQRLRHAYVQAIEKAGGVPLLLPMSSKTDVVEPIIRLIDGLLITGGPAVTAGLVGVPPADLDENDQRRLEADTAFVKAFERKKAPVLGICYGMQLLNALDGGTIYADVEKQVPGSMVHSAIRGAGEHPVSLEAGTLLREILGTDEMNVNSRHIQAIASVGSSFRVAARAGDGVVESIESLDGRILGVQFHPERMKEMMPLFRYFVQKARDHRVEQAPDAPFSV